MRKLLLAGAATIGVLAAPAVLSAQDTDAEIAAEVAADVVLTAEQQAIYDAWPVDRPGVVDRLLFGSQYHVRGDLGRDFGIGILRGQDGRGGENTDRRSARQ